MVLTIGADELRVLEESLRSVDDVSRINDVRKYFMRYLSSASPGQWMSAASAGRCMSQDDGSS